MEQPLHLSGYYERLAGQPNAAPWNASNREVLNARGARYSLDGTVPVVQHVPGVFREWNWGECGVFRQKLEGMHGVQYGIHICEHLSMPLAMAKVRWGIHSAPDDETAAAFEFHGGDIGGLLGPHLEHLTDVRFDLEYCEDAQEEGLTALYVARGLWIQASSGFTNPTIEHLTGGDVVCNYSRRLDQILDSVRSLTVWPSSPPSWHEWAGWWEAQTH